MMNYHLKQWLSADYIFLLVNFHEGLIKGDVIGYLKILLLVCIQEKEQVAIKQQKIVLQELTLEDMEGFRLVFTKR